LKKAKRLSDTRNTELCIVSLFLVNFLCSQSQPSADGEISLPKTQIRLECRLFILPATAMTIDKHSCRTETVQHSVLGILEKCPKVNYRSRLLMVVREAVLPSSSFAQMLQTLQVGTQCPADDPPLKSWSERHVWKFSSCFKGFCVHKFNH